MRRVNGGFRSHPHYLGHRRAGRDQALPGGTLGAVALAGASLVAIATLLTKQHYIADVITGGALAVVADVVWLRGYSPEHIPSSTAASHQSWRSVSVQLSALGSPVNAYVAPLSEELADSFKK